MSEYPLIFLGIIPPSGISANIQEMKYYVRDTYNSAHSLNAPPHITILSPFREKEGKRDEIYTFFREYCEQQHPFKIRMNGFSVFPPRVVFIDVKQSRALMNFQHDLEEKTRSADHLMKYNYDRRPFHPHITLAFKDLTKKNFYKCWSDFKGREFEESFMCRKLSLLQHNGEKWLVLKNFPFKTQQ